MTEHKYGFSADDDGRLPPTEPPPKPPPALGQQVLPEDLIEYIKILRVQPMDVVVLKVTHKISLQQQSMIMRGLRQVLPAGVGAMILDGDYDMEVIRPDAGPDAGELPTGPATN